MLVGKRHYSFNLLVSVGIHNDVNASREDTVSKGKDFSEGGTVRVHNTLPLEERSTIQFLVTKLFQESMIEVRSVNVHVSLLWCSLVEVNTSIFLCPLLQMRKLLSTDIIAASY
jgi:hypothetical protein